MTVFAAASLRGALDEVAQSYGAPVTLSYAGSGTLARQIAAGAPADVIVLAHGDWAMWLQARGLLLEDTLADVAGGQLVLIGPAGAEPFEVSDAAALREALKGGRLAIGQRDGVPAGTYARDWLQHLGAWDDLQPHLAETDNVRAALALVAVGAAPLAVVYASDAQAEPRVASLYAIPPQTHAPIRYPAAALTEAGRVFVSLLQSPQAAETFARHGFAP
ncbi:MAG: molybdate ABC transporter substrate-binding protein [Sulfitobacter sp.]